MQVNRTQNLFVRKSPDILQTEQKMKDLQYRQRQDRPTGYENIKFNTEYQAPGGLNFGITKVGDQEIPYIFEGGTPYEISQTDPSYATITDLLKEQDKKIGRQ